jgi:glucokinase
MSSLAIGIDLGGTFIKAGVITDEGHVIGQWKITTEGHKGGPVVVQRMVDLIGEILRSPEVTGCEDKVVGIGLGSPGLVDQKMGTITRPVNIPNWEDGICVKEVFEQRYGLPTSADNDANACGLGEARFGAGRGRSVVVALTLGTGVGGAIVADGKVFHGARGYAGELGHTCVDPEGPPCACGGNGCVETYASANAIAKYAAALVAQGRHKSLLVEWSRDGTPITSKLVHEAALQNDALALRVIQRAGRYLGVAAGNFCVAVNPEVIVIGGGASAMGDLLFDHVRREIEMRVFFSPYFKTEVCRALLGEDAGFIGAACLALAPS